MVNKMENTKETPKCMDCYAPTELKGQVYICTRCGEIYLEEDID